MGRFETDFIMVESFGSEYGFRLAANYFGGLKPDGGIENGEGKRTFKMPDA